MLRKQRSGIIYVLIECTIITLLFAFSAVICVQMQAYTNDLNESTAIRHSVMREASSMIDALECSQLKDLSYKWQKKTDTLYRSHALEYEQIWIDLQIDDPTLFSGTLRFYDEDKTWITLPFVTQKEAIQ